MAFGAGIILFLMGIGCGCTLYPILKQQGMPCCFNIGCRFHPPAFGQGNVMEHFVDALL
jgi:hypothetical protein